MLENSLSYIYILKWSAPPKKIAMWQLIHKMYSFNYNSKLLCTKLHYFKIRHQSGCQNLSLNTLINMHIEDSLKSPGINLCNALHKGLLIKTISVSKRNTLRVTLCIRLLIPNISLWWLLKGLSSGILPSPKWKNFSIRNNQTV